MDGSSFRVIIVGGSIAGLSLAHCLHKAGIDCIILEKRRKIVQSDGGFVGVLPNGGRILEQLGLYAAVEKLIEPMRRFHLQFPDGFHFSHSYPQDVHDQFGYPMAFLGRQQLLQILYESLPRPPIIHVSKTVTHIEQQDNTVLVYTRDGSKYTGDLVVGADGVHSRVRTQMWRIADTLQPGLITDQEKRIKIDYACIFGTSTAVPGLNLGRLHLTVCDGHSFILAPAPQARLSWFIVIKLNRQYRYGAAPCFSTADADAWCEQRADQAIWADVTFEQVWKNRETIAMVPLEEKLFQHWHYGRLVCIGDSVHKMTPNLGQGANSAIEDAAVLANEIRDALVGAQNPTSLSDRAVDALLSRFSTKRLARMTKVYRASKAVVRVQTRQVWLYNLILRHLVPYSGSLPAKQVTKIFEDAAALTFVPLPRRGCGAEWS
ncbi:putative FAD binding monooxygenase [Aspergillus homomorphus CBS 101889]|uniref:Putative FAD binding monooxygenase n=1 Tax=Aspergillus homomorphus (strain CBS 101889) TaxID=1450537 RepID=A0A395HYD2_ASPHC|nr:putative FAD binding monooxygenase [Aspergillus homomorphus CBS 101889]RAL12393.1 putative FAD binding monooxygenase [Aspergillus homomorphus CBS 101889]